MKPKLAEMKAKMESLDQDQISHIELITPTADPSEDVRTFAIVEYTELLDKIINRSESEGDVYTVVDDMATFPGDMPALLKHIASNLLYPVQARRMGIEGTVFVEFVVQTDGSITDIRAKKGIGAGCDEEAIKAVQSLPKWNPGKNNGVAVKSRLVLPINFKLNGSNAKDEAKAPANATEEVVVVGQPPKPK
jgi:TonB family protein